MTDRPEPASLEGDDVDADVPADEVHAESVEPEATKPVKLSKAERLEAKAARLREAEERRAEERRAASERSAVGQPPRSRTGLVVAVSVLGVLSAGLVAVLVIGYLSWQHQRDVNSARDGALKAAKTFAVDFGSYDYQHLDSEFKEVAGRMTPSFAKNYTQTSTKLKPTLVQYKTKVTATLQGAGVTSASPSAATVVVFLDQTVNTSQSSVPRLDRNRLQIQLQRTNGKWLVGTLLAK
jgi:Mce-associated membrane protein